MRREQRQGGPGKPELRPAGSAPGGHSRAGDPARETEAAAAGTAIDTVAARPVQRAADSGTGAGQQAARGARRDRR